MGRCIEENGLPVRKLTRKWKWIFFYLIIRAPTHKRLRIHDHGEVTKGCNVTVWEYERKLAIYIRNMDMNLRRR